MQTWGMYFVCSCLNNGWAGLFEPETLRRMALDIDASAADGPRYAVDRQA
jgi:hypothetical protein